MSRFAPFLGQIAGLVSVTKIRTKVALTVAQHLVAIQKMSKDFLGHFLYIENFKLAPTYSPPKGVPSVLESLTSVFGMGTGVPPLPKHQLKTFNECVYVKLRYSEVVAVPLLSCVSRRRGTAFDACWTEGAEPYSVVAGPSKRRALKCRPSRRNSTHRV